MATIILLVLQAALLLTLLILGEVLMLAGAIAAIGPVIFSRRQNLGISLLGLLLFIAAARGLILQGMP